MTSPLRLVDDYSAQRVDPAGTLGRRRIAAPADEAGKKLAAPDFAA